MTAGWMLGRRKLRADAVCSVRFCGHLVGQPCEPMILLCCVQFFFFFLKGYEYDGGNCCDVCVANSRYNCPGLSARRNLIMYQVCVLQYDDYIFSATYSSIVGNTRFSFFPDSTLDDSRVDLKNSRDAHSRAHAQGSFFYVLNTTGTTYGTSAKSRPIYVMVSFTYIVYIRYLCVVIPFTYFTRRFTFQYCSFAHLSGLVTQDGGWSHRREDSQRPTHTH